MKGKIGLLPYLTSLPGIFAGIVLLALTDLVDKGAEVIALSTAGGFFIGLTIASVKTERHLLKAIRYVKRGQSPEALAELKECLRLHPWRQGQSSDDSLIRGANQPLGRIPTEHPPASSAESESSD